MKNLDATKSDYIKVTFGAAFILAVIATFTSKHLTEQLSSVEPVAPAQTQAMPELKQKPDFSKEIKGYNDAKDKFLGMGGTVDAWGDYQRRHNLGYDKLCHDAPYGLVC